MGIFKKGVIKITVVEYRDEIKLLLSGGILNLEISDETIDKIINSAFREVQRYIDSTRMITIPFSKVIDMTPYHVSSVARVYRAYSNVTASGDSNEDPVALAQWQLMTGNIYNYQDYVYNFAAWNTIAQTRNTVSTDLSFLYDKSSNKLFINVANGVPGTITIEYIPKYADVAEIVSDFWIDVLLKMSLAMTKIVLGRVRSRFTQSNALWTQDGDTMLSEGTSELVDLRAQLVASTQLVYPVD